MNQIDPLASTIIKETMPNSTIWVDIKNVFQKVKHIFDIISVVFKETPSKLANVLEKEGIGEM
jgi:hypothetical protein